VRRKIPGSLLATALVCYAASGACEPLPLGDGPRRAAVKALVQDVVLPELATLEAETTALVAAVHEAARDPAQLEGARVAWRRARDAWKRLEPISLGPAVSLRLGARLDQWPVDAAKVLELVDTGTLTPAALGELGANRLGFHALEAVLYVDDAAVRWREPRVGALAGALAEVLAADARAPESGLDRRLRAAARRHRRQRRRLHDGGRRARRGGQRAHRAHREAAGHPAGQAAGARLGAVHRAPELEESPLADGSLADLSASLAGLERAYVVGLAPLVVARSVPLDTRVRAAFDEAEARVAAVPLPFAAALTARAPEAAAAHEAVRALWVLLRTEVVSTLGAVLKLNDNDGD
jgi:predicted lipoprotein